jgi:hypothetical protein
MATAETRQCACPTIPLLLLAAATVVGEGWDQTAEVQIQQWTDAFTFLKRTLSSPD